MKPGPTKPDAELVKKVAEAAAAAKQEVLRKSALDALMKTAPEELIAPEEDPEVVKGNAKGPYCWIKSPAMMELYAATDQRLTRVAQLAGLQVKRVPKVHARLLPGTKLVTLKPTHGEDSTGIKVVRSGSNISINLISLLGDKELTIEHGYRELFKVFYIPEGTPHYPGLLIDLGDVLDRRKESASPSAGEAKEKKVSKAAEKAKGSAGAEAKTEPKAQANPEPAVDPEADDWEREAALEEAEWAKKAMEEAKAKEEAHEEGEATKRPPGDL